MSPNHVSEQFKILSLDGGGVRGYLTAKILANIEHYLNERENKTIELGKRFDFIAGTSTGGLIALALACGKTAKETFEFYEKYIPNVFGGKAKNKIITVWPDCFSNIRLSKYRPTLLRDAIEEFFNVDTTFENLQTDLLITSVALQNAKPRFHKSDYIARNKGRIDERLVDVALATSAAPTYFPAHSMKHSQHLIDGGICANNPALVALIDAFQFEQESKRGNKGPKSFPDDIKQLCMISVGTGEQGCMPYDIERLKNGGRLNWAAPISEVLMESQSQLVHTQTKFILKDAYLRINPQLKFPMKLDDTDQLHELKNLADIDRKIEEFLIENFS